ILSEGKEVTTSVKLSLTDTKDTEHKVEDQSPAANPAPDNPANVAWEVPDSDERLADVVRDEFRIRFATPSWTGKIGSSQVLTARRLTSLESANPSSGADSCVWFPGDAGSGSRLLAASEPIAYLVTARDQEGQSSASVSFSMNTPAGAHLGTLQCFFPRTA